MGLGARRCVSGLLVAIVALAVAVTWFASTSEADTASVSVSASASATQGVPETVTVSGSTQLARDLFVEVQGSDSTCPAEPDLFDGTELSNVFSGDAIGPGSFTKTYTYTPSDADTTYTVCAYVDDNDLDTPDAQGSASFKLNESVASLVSHNPIGGVPSTITISGQSQLPTKLYAYILMAGKCATTPSKTAASTSLDATLYDGAAVGPNAYSETYDFAPDYSDQAFTICTYLDQSDTGTPDASGSTDFTAGRANASVHISASGHATIGSTEKITVTGKTQIPASVDVRIFFGRSTTSLPAQHVAAGSFSKTFVYHVGSYGQDSVEASVTEAIKSAATLDFVDIGLAVPAATLVSPAGGVRGSQIDPTFVWKAPAGSQYAVLIDSVATDGKVTNLMQLQANGYADLPSPGLSSKTRLVERTALSSIRRVARFTTKRAGLDIVRLDRALPPGKYTWQVVSAGPKATPAAAVISAPRTFTVLGPPLTHLHVSTQAKPGETYKYPGYSLININTSPYVRISLQIRTRGKTQSFTENLTSQRTAQLTLTWSCTHPAQGRVPFTVEATDQLGHTKTAHGSLVYAPLSLCMRLHAQLLAVQLALKEKREQAEQQKLKAEQQQQQQEEAAAEAAQQAQYNRFVNNCKALGGTPVTLQLSSGDSTFCRAPWGGYMNIPDY
jgi:hypothetical protein